MVLAFRREVPVQPAFPGFPTTLPDFSATAIRDVFIQVAGSMEADIVNARQLPDRERFNRLLALKERVAALEHEVSRWQDLIGMELNLMGHDS